MVTSVQRRNIERQAMLLDSSPDPAHAYHDEFRAVMQNGAVRWLAGEGRLETNVAGIPVRAFGVICDVTARKRAQELLQRQADLLAQSHDAIFTWKIGGGIVYWNRGAEVLYGYTAEDAIGRSSHELLRTVSPIPIHEIEAQIAREGSWYGEVTHTTRDGRTIVVESRHVRICYDGETYALETNRDITERKEREEREHLLMREINHRAKNMLSVVDAIALQTTTKSPEDFRERLSARIQALAANQDLLIRNAWHGVEIEDLGSRSARALRRSRGFSYRHPRPQAAFECGFGASHRARAP
jgi:PAS domain S-box-containing protein